MRAARVLQMLLILQRRGRLTARELGTTLEVSERTGYRLPHGELRRIATSIRRRRRIELHRADGPAVTVEPLGLVHKAGSWHLVAATAGEPAVIGLAGLRATRLTTQPFKAPPGFALTDFWAAHLASAAVPGPPPVPSANPAQSQPG